MNQFDHHKKGMITFIYEPFAILFPSFLLPYGWMSWAKTMATAFLFLCVEKLFKWVNEKNTFFRYLQYSTVQLLSRMDYFYIYYLKIKTMYIKNIFHCMRIICQNIWPISITSWLMQVIILFHQFLLQIGDHLTKTLNKYHNRE